MSLGKGKLSEIITLSKMEYRDKEQLREKLRERDRQTSTKAVYSHENSIHLVIAGPLAGCGPLGSDFGSVCVCRRCRFWIAYLRLLQGAGCPLGYDVSRWSDVWSGPDCRPRH
ncbi:uncharacterized protein MONBRDRAFT_26827 [Monosiga brevicollis MX1]|uniref:Uncharacterized protein n=1 Tax=Monosiga brevicollis TaxID=81824 RepID=A9V3M7_MONBE|nr:uncharacterized protein MONBRDRAFT_26827 [Monosiga brevicollis MX1]EDQ87729.1 predicted protein [Monosiga brevicollis MX1]|eukprot:XP_001747262.1 hypothetical protein [Monosiga brevicollis MX1]